MNKIIPNAELYEGLVRFAGGRIADADHFVLPNNIRILRAPLSEEDQQKSMKQLQTALTERGLSLKLEKQPTPEANHASGMHAASKMARKIKQLETDAAAMLGEASELRAKLKSEYGKFMEVAEVLNMPQIGARSAAITVSAPVRPTVTKASEHPRARQGSVRDAVLSALASCPTPMLAREIAVAAGLRIEQVSSVLNARPYKNVLWKHADEQRANKNCRWALIEQRERR